MESTTAVTLSLPNNELLLIKWVNNMNFDCIKNIQVELQDSGILQLTLNRPEALNALNKELMDELYSILLNSKTESKVKAILLTGQGKAFCAGADINQLAALTGQDGLTFAQQGQHVFRLLEQLGKPSLAAINGFALGGGCELAMAATLRIASEKAVFGQPEVKLGVIPGFGGTQRLARLIGKGQGIRFMFNWPYHQSSRSVCLGISQ